MVSNLSSSRSTTPSLPVKAPGLACRQCRGFCGNRAGWMVQVYSEPGQGTTFKLYFLALDGDYPDLLQEVPQTQSRRDSQARVLVVEDAADLMTRLVVTLNKAGFDVRPAATGDQALAF